MINSCNNSWVRWQKHPLLSRFVLFPLFHTLFLFMFVSPGSTGHESGEFLLWRNAELGNFFWSCSAVDSSKSLEPLRLQRVFNILPAPSTIISSVWGHGCERREMTIMFAAVCPGDYWTSPHVEEDSGGASDSQDESGGEKNNLVIQSVLVFFVLFHGLLWQGGVNPCSGKKLCMWPASPFS